MVGSLDVPSSRVVVMAGLVCPRMLPRDTLGAMRWLRLYTELPLPKRRLLLRAVALVAAVRIALWTLPFRWVRLVGGRRRAVSTELSTVPVEHLAWAVQAAGRRIPGASCLTQALSLQYLMTLDGHDAEVHIGVAKDATRGFEAHAWVEYGGKILLGDDGDLGRYAPMLALSSEES